MELQSVSHDELFYPKHHGYNEYSGVHNTRDELPPDTELLPRILNPSQSKFLCSTNSQ